MEIKPKKSNRGCDLIEYLGRSFIKIPFSMDENSGLENYVNIIINKWDENNTLIEIFDTEYAEDIFDTISNRIDVDKSLSMILENISELLYKIKSKYLKFRGDLSEAMFLAFVGGKSINDGEMYDIEYNGKYIEVKSYSRQKNTIIISYEQLIEDTDKFAIAIAPSQSGFSIIDLAKLIESSNPKFSNYLIKKYSKDSQLANRKFEKTEAIDITKQLREEIKLPKNIVSGKFEIKIEI